MAHVEKRPGNRPGWRVRWRDADDRYRMMGFPTRRQAEVAMASMAGERNGQPHTIPRGTDEHGEYYVGRYRGPGGEWLETDEFYDEQDALDEARELEAAAQADNGQER